MIEVWLLSDDKCLKCGGEVWGVEETQAGICSECNYPQLAWWY